MRVAVFSAFPHELRRTIRKLSAVRDPGGHPFALYFARHSSKEVILVLTGMGPQSAQASLAYVTETYSPDVILSVGFGGALYRGARAGDLVWASKVLLLKDSGVVTLDLIQAREIYGRVSGRTAMQEGSVLTLERWMNKAEIRRAAPQGLPFPVCDTETFPLAELSAERGLPFFAVRSITDRADEEIPPQLLGVSDESGRYRLHRAVYLLLRKPRLIPVSLKLGRNSWMASGSLWVAVRSLIEEL